MANEPRAIQTVFENKSGSKIINGIMKLTGMRDDFKFTLTSIRSTDSSNSVECLMRISIDISGLYNRAAEYGYTDNLINKIQTKFTKYTNMEITTPSETNQSSFVVFTIGSEEFITSVKKTIKLEKQVGIYTRSLKSIAAYVNKMIEKKVERQRKVAERRAQKAALAKESAEAVAPRIVKAVPVTSELVSEFEM